jgi:threonine/homoserine/homoserine lactone efflux protein
MTGSLLAYLLISLAVIVTPGPDTALTIRNTLLGGRPSGIGTALGVSTGQMVWALATSAGLVAVLLASEQIFEVLRLIGAAYLIWLGVLTLWRVFGREGTVDPDGPHVARRRLSPLAGFRQGFLSNLANPKMAAYFASVLPHFAPDGQGMLSSLVLLGFVFACMTLAWLAFYAVVIASAGDAFRRSRLRRAVEGIMGATLVGLGVRVAVEQR